MSSKWQEKNLCEIATLIDSLHATPSYSEEGKPMVRVTDIKPGIINIKDSNKVSEKIFNEFSRRYKPKKGDTIITRVGSYGITAQVKNNLDFCLGQNIAAIRPTNIDPDYLFYCFQDWKVKNQIEFSTVGSTQRTLSLKAINDLKIPTPPFPEQKAIAQVLSALDDKIELNRQMNETLENIARTLFKDWFIDFGPVKAKIAGQEPPGRSSEIAALFPDSLNKEGIPKGWSLSPFSNLIELIGGGTPKTSIQNYWNGDIHWYSVVDSPKNGDVFVIKTEKTITQDGLSNSSTKVLDVGTTIISARGTVGKLALVGVPMAMNQSCYGVKSSLGLFPYFNYFLMHSLVSSLQNQTHGSVFDTITKDTFKSIKTTMPPLDVITRFEGIVSSLMQTILENQKQSITISRLRDTLLPKLVSGEVRVQDIEESING